MPDNTGRVRVRMMNLWREMTWILSIVRFPRDFMPNGWRNACKPGSIEGTIGPLRQVLIRFGIPPFSEGAANIRYSKELGGGALLDNGAYTLKAASYLLGSDLTVLAAMNDINRPGKDGVGDNVDITGSMMLRAAGGVPVQTAYGFSHFYQNGYEIWGKDGKITTTRAFTARPDFAAPVILETRAGRTEQTFKDDHFANLLTHIANRLADGEFANEYEQNLLQARLIADCALKMELA